MRTDSPKRETVQNRVALQGYVRRDVTLESGQRLHLDVRSGSPRGQAGADLHPATVEMHDARVVQTESGCSPADFIKQYSFVLLDHQTAMSDSGWSDWGEVSSVYAAEVKHPIRRPDRQSQAEAQPDATVVLLPEDDDGRGAGL